MLAPGLATLLDDARAEAKRAGHATATPLHLAAALARRAPQAFEAAFGSGSASAAQAALLRSTPAGSEADTLAVLEAASSEDPVVVIAALKQRLGELGLGNGGTPEPPAHDDPQGGPTSDADAPPSHATAAIPPPPPPSAAGGSDRLLEPVAGDPTIRGFEQVVDELVSLLSMRRPATPLLQGRWGSGKSTVVVALATRLEQPAGSGPLAGAAVVRFNNAAALNDNPVGALNRALESQKADEILVLDDLQSLLSLGSGATILPLLALLRAAVADPARRMVLIIDEEYAGRLETVDQELAAALVPVQTPPLEVDLLWDIARQEAAELAEHHGVTMGDAVTRLAAGPPGAAERRANPGLLIERLDRACARAAMRPDRKVSEHDLGLGMTPEAAPLDTSALVERLRRRVRGQDQALQPVAARLALTRAQLDLRPARPDGVFLFVGPTGVGKTELARALCEQLFGDESRLIRLDMSEYAESWALARLIGPQPGYVGFTEPEAWLTTRIRKQADTVLLLDEVEKAHPSVWNAFLQVFDAGRLTDARGNVANFEPTVVAMTSNLGSADLETAPIGFTVDDEAATAERDEQVVRDAVKRAMPPELINRLDDIVVFKPLTREAILEIAQIEVNRLHQRLAERGYVTTIGHEVVELLATTGYDPHYGARHLQRNVEHLLLEPLASASSRDLTAAVVDGAVVWRDRRHHSR